MKKLMSVMLGLAFLAGTGTLGFAQDQPQQPKKEKKSKKGGKKKKEKKEGTR